MAVKVTGMRFAASPFNRGVHLFSSESKRAHFPLYFLRTLLRAAKTFEKAISQGLETEILQSKPIELSGLGMDILCTE